MRIYVLASLAFLTLGVPTNAMAAPKAKAVKLEAGKTVKVKGKLEKGASIDLAWATNSSVACFPSVKNEHFDGNHVLFTTSLPAKSVLKIEAKPKKGDTDISLYAYSIGTSRNDLPPAISSVVSCEASYGTSSMSKPYNPGKAEKVELNAIKNPYNVVIGVAGAQKLAKGAFTLELSLETAEAAPTGKIKSATPIKAKSGKTVSVEGNIKGGKQIDLAFAANSSVACFPATKNDHFDGNHVVYSFDIPKQTTAKIELVPAKSDEDLSLYAYSVGATSTVLPPDIPSVVSCEASYGTNSMSKPYNPGGTEKVELVAINNPYKAFIGVAGAQKLTKGKFTLKVTLTPR